MPDFPEEHDPQRDACLAAIAQACRAARFDVHPLRETPSLRMAAAFHQRGEGFVLVRKATLWAAEIHEYLYVYTPRDLNASLWRDIRDDALDRGLTRIRAHDEHMTSYVSAVLLCRSWDIGMADAVRRTRFIKSFLWGLHGWARLRTLAVRLPPSKDAPAVLACNASARNALLPLIRDALSPLFPLAPEKNRPLFTFPPRKGASPT